VAWLPSAIQRMARVRSRDCAYISEKNIVRDDGGLPRGYKQTSRRHLGQARFTPQIGQIADISVCPLSSQKATSDAVANVYTPELG
jgi:hypothetical protein